MWRGGSRLTKVTACYTRLQSETYSALPGRTSKRDYPGRFAERPDWANYVQILRDAAAASYRAAQSKNQDAIVQVSDTLTRACDACHVAYRDKYKNTGNTRVCEP